MWNTNDDRIDTPILAIFYEKTIFENVEMSLYSLGFVNRTIWNTNDDRYSHFSQFLLEKTSSELGILKMWICL